VLRFADTPREEGELCVDERLPRPSLGITARVTGVVDPDDDKPVRIDGNYFASSITGSFARRAGRWWVRVETADTVEQRAAGWPIALNRACGAVQVEMAQLDRSVASDDLDGTDGR
jgi:hypothetical protein